MNHSFSVEIAEKFGIEKAVILENFYFWIRKNKANKKNIHEGRCYTYNTAEAFAELFPYIKERRIAQLLREMETEDNLLLSGQFFNYDRTKSYTLTDFALSFFESSNIQNFDNGTYKNLTMEHTKTVDCLNTDINTDVNPNINTQECVPVYVPDPTKIKKSDYQELKDAMFNLIVNHNKNARHKIPISKHIMYFEQKEGVYIRNLLQQYNAQEIKTALENYLTVANMETWKTSFSFPAFCNSIQEYTPEYFDITKYLNLSKGGLAKIINDFISEKMEQHLVFRLDAFIYHRQDWLKAGMPDGEELQKLVKQWEKDDEKNKIDYYIVNDNWEKQGGEK